MAYDPKAFSNMVGGGGCPDIAPKGNSKRPQSYTGKYVSDIPGALSRPQDDGAEHPGIAPKQAFRKEGNAPKNSDALLDGQYDGNAVTDAPTFEDVYKKWQ